jgi:hypothetical protein
VAFICDWLLVFKNRRTYWQWLAELLKTSPLDQLSSSRTWGHAGPIYDVGWEPGLCRVVPSLYRHVVDISAPPGANVCASWQCTDKLEAITYIYYPAVDWKGLFLQAPVPNISPVAEQLIQIDHKYLKRPLANDDATIFL